MDVQAIRLMRPVAAFVVLASVSVFALPASASTERPIGFVENSVHLEGAEESPTGGLVESMDELIEDQIDSRSEFLNSSAAVNERAQSSDQFEHLNRGQAVDLLQETFGDAIAGLAANPAEALLEADKILNYDADTNTAVINPSGSATRALIVSDIPLTTDSGDVPDLSLESHEGEIQATEPLSEVTIPSDPSDPISFERENVHIALTENGDNSPDANIASSIGLGRNDDLAFFPNIYEDTDVAVASIPGGIETFTHVRSAAAPDQYRFDVGAPEGSTIHLDSTGGAIVQDSGGKGLISVSPPVSTDAQGVKVPTTMTVDGAQLVVHLDHEAGEVAYPILLDPVFESWNWMSSNYPAGWGTFQGWVPTIAGSTQYQFNTECTSGITSSCETSAGGSGQGVHVNAPGGRTYAANSQASYNYTVPGANSYIYSANVASRRYYKGAASTVNNPYAFWGLKNASTWRDIWFTNASSTGALSFNGYVASAADRAKTFSTGLVSDASGTIPGGTSNFRYNRVAQTTFDLRDGGNPTMSPLNLSWMPTGWLDGESFAVLASAADAGLGIKEIKAVTSNHPTDLPQPVFTSTWTPSNHCTGGSQSLCPASTTLSPVIIDTSKLASGRRMIAIEAHDALDYMSNYETFYAKVDHKKPTVVVTGGAVDTSDPGVDLRIVATDGNLSNDDEIGSGIKTVVVKIEGETVYSEAIDCVLTYGTCPESVTREIQLPYQELVGVDQDISIEVRDQLGHLGTKLDASPALWHQSVSRAQLAFSSISSEGNVTPGYGPGTDPQNASCSPTKATARKYVVRKDIQNASDPNDDTFMVEDKKGCADLIDLSLDYLKKVNVVRAGGGNDVVLGWSGRQTIRGGQGNDLLTGGRNNDYIHGESGYDRVYGGTDDDDLYGGSGNDLVAGGAGSDKAYGESGSDTIRGGQGGDTLSAGVDNDIDSVSFVDGGSPGFDQRTQSSSDPNRIDVSLPAEFPQYSSGERGVFVQLGSSVDGPNFPTAYNGRSRTAGGLDVLCRPRRDVDACADTDDRFDRVEGSPFSDVIIGSSSTSRKEYLIGGWGADVIRGSGGPDQIFGGGDGDYLTGAVHASINGGVGDGLDGCVFRPAGSPNGGGAPEDSTQETQCDRRTYHVDPSVRDPNKVFVGRVEHRATANDDEDYWSRSDLILKGSVGPDHINVSYSSKSPNRINQVVNPLSQQVVFRIGALSSATFDTSVETGCDITAKKAVCTEIDPRFSAVHGTHRYFPLGAVVLDGGRGDDLIYSDGFPQWAQVTMLGGEGADTLQGGPSEETEADGDGQDDGIGLSSQPEQLIGSAGDDTIINNRGRDLESGGDGNDLLLSTSLCDGDWIDGGKDDDSSQWAQLPRVPSGFESGVSDRNLQPGVFASLGAPEGLTTTTVGKVGYFLRKGDTTPYCPPGQQLSELASIRDLEGSGNDDFLRGNSADNKVLPRGGYDAIEGKGGSDTLQGADNKIDLSIDCGAGDLRPDSGNYDSNESGKLANCSTDTLSDTVTPRYVGDAVGPYDESQTVAPVPTATSDPGDDYLVGNIGHLSALVDSNYELGDMTRSTPALSDLGSSKIETVYTFSTESIDGGEIASPLDSPPEATFIDSSYQAEDEQPEVLMSPATVVGALPDVQDPAIEIDEGDRVDLSTAWDPAAPGLPGYSVELWARFDDAPGEMQTLFSRGDDLGEGVSMFRDSEGKIHFSSATPSGEASTTSADAPALGAWHHLVGTLEGHDLSLYVDGFRYSVGYDHSVIPGATPGESNILGAEGGTWGEEPEHPLDGAVDDVAIYGEALSEVDVSAHLAESDVDEPEYLLLPQSEPPEENADDDGDDLPDAFDNCPGTSNQDQFDQDRDGDGDLCDSDVDLDGDAVSPSTDNCPIIFNPAQIDDDSDGVGNECEDLEPIIPEE